MVYLSEISILIALGVRWNQSSHSDKNERCGKLGKFTDLHSSFNIPIHLIQMSFDICSFIAVE